jgi:hypothetical protein
MVQFVFNQTLNILLGGLGELTKFSEVAKNFGVKVKIVNIVEGDLSKPAIALKKVLVDLIGEAKRVMVVVNDNPADLTLTIKSDGGKLIISIESPFMKVEKFEENDLEAIKFVRKVFRELESMLGGDIPSADIEVETEAKNPTRQTEYFGDVFARKVYPILNGVSVNKLKSELKKND